MSCDICGRSVTGKGGGGTEKKIGVRMCARCWEEDVAAQERRRRVTRRGETLRGLAAVFASGRLARDGRMGGVMVVRR